MMAISITYFLGCLWYYNSFLMHESLLKTGEEDLYRGGTWYNKFNLQDKDLMEKVMMSQYFALSTLSTVGYGDLFPISSQEMIIGVFVMLMGVFFFSYIMGQLLSIGESMDQKLGYTNKVDDFNVWIFGLSKYRSKEELPMSLLF